MPEFLCNKIAGLQLATLFILKKRLRYKCVLFYIALLLLHFPGFTEAAVRVIFTGKYLCWSLFSIKLSTEGMQLFKKGTPTQGFPANIAKLLRGFYTRRNFRFTLDDF